MKSAPKTTGVIKLVRNGRSISKDASGEASDFKVKSFEEIMREKKEKQKKIEATSNTPSPSDSTRVKSFEEIKKAKLQQNGTTQKPQVKQIPTKATQVANVQAAQRNGSVQRPTIPKTAVATATSSMSPKRKQPEEATPAAQTFAKRTKTVEAKTVVDTSSQNSAPVSAVTLDTHSTSKFSSALDTLDDDDDLKEMLGITSEFTVDMTDADISNFEKELMEL
jgi:ribosomal protein L14E/L6E/L27E